MVNCDMEWIEVEFEEYARCAAVMIYRAFVMGDAVLIGVQWGGAGCDVGRGDNMQEVLVRNKGYKF